MLVIQDPFRETDLPHDCVSTVGNFDGIHVGHQQIVERVVRLAREASVPPVVITFDPHPLAIISPDRVPARILTTAQKAEILEGMGVEALLVIPFTPELSRMPAADFAKELFVDALKIRHLLVGRDFHFGAGRKGDVALLQAMGKDQGFEVTPIDDVTVRGIRVSSSIVRDAIRKGALHVVRITLGRDHFIDGVVETGRRLGRKLGVPTVNLAPDNELFPESGVFVTSSTFDSFGRAFPSVTNIGVRPTLYENYGRTIESHVLDFHANVYGDRVRLTFHRLLRRERQFESALELSAQIQQDIQHAHQFFEGRPPI